LNKYLKGIFLTATLLIPVVIFLFLKFFGENKFDIPIYYQEGVPHAFNACEFTNGIQYQISDPSVTGPRAYVFIEDNKGFNQVKNIEQRINQSVDNLDIKIYTSDSSKMVNDKAQFLPDNEFLSKLRCVFASDTLDQFILVDSKKRIRGYYRFDREEVDRFIVESKILVDNEQNVD